MGAGLGSAFDYDYILKQLITTLLRDLWDDDRRRKFVKKFVKGRIEASTRPIVGVGIGESDNRLQLEFLSAVDAGQLLIEDLLLSWNWGDVRFEVIRTGRIVAAARSSAVPKKAQGGDAIQRIGGQSGTFGCLVDGSFGSGILTSHHVLVSSINGKEKHEIQWSGRRIGVLERLEPLVLGPSGENKVDAAVCKPDDLSKIAPGLRNLGPVSGSVRDPVFGLRIKKEGAASGVTEGAIRIKDLSTIVSFETGDEVIFTEQLGIIGTKHGVPFAARGDSGAIAVNNENSPVGLVFAVAEGVDLAFANPIEAVFRSLQVRLP